MFMLEAPLEKEQFASDFLSFLEKSPTPFHVVRNVTDILDNKGFTKLEESEKWSLQPSSKYYVIRNGSSIIAFITGRQKPEITGIRLTGAHTDSPCLKLKPAPEIRSSGYLGLDVEVYGGVLLNTWFDRDLSIAGRITSLTSDDRIISCLIDFADNVAFIPSLAIHLNRDVNNSKSVNPQKELIPITMHNSNGDSSSGFMSLLLEKAKNENQGITEILEHDLYLYDTQKPSFIGMGKEFIAGARIDNLLSCFAGTKAISEAGTDFCSVLVLNDNEEVGSTSISGADGQFLKSVLERICGIGESFSVSMSRSLMISTDNAHGVHPNYSEKHDANHRPIMNKGPAIKINANQRYATNSETSGLIKALAKKTGIYLQTFTMRSDMACGSTIGPITASILGIRTIDIGAPTLGMHSIREMAGKNDVYDLYELLKAFNNSELFY